MLLSVVIPTFNSPPSLGKLLSSLSRQELQNNKLQVICVNNIKKSFKSDLAKQWSVYFYDFKYFNSEKIGANSARNTGIRFSSGEIIWFLDDDCELVSDNSYIQRIIQLHKEYPEVVGIGGQYYSPDLLNKLSQTYFDMTNQWLDQSLIGHYFTSNLIGGNASYKREIFDNGMRFDTHLVFGATELSLNKQITDNGNKLILKKSLNVIHHQHLNIFMFLKKAYKQGQGKAYLGIPFHNEVTTIPPNLYVKLYGLFFKLGFNREVKNVSKKNFFFIEIIQGSKIYIFFRHYISHAVIKVLHMAIYHHSTYLLPALKKISGKK
jgi:glycosyltransferase involved in cell wall biosynthesis